MRGTVLADGSHSGESPLKGTSIVTSKTSFLAFALVGLIAACSSDPNKKADDAHDAEIKANSKAEQDRAEDRKDANVKAAEKAQDGTAAPTGASSATQNRVEADSKVVEARRVYKAKATERLEKADARSNEMKGLLDRAGGKASLQARESVATVDRQRGAVRRDIDGLDQVPADAWKDATTHCDADLDTLDGYVKQAGKEVDKAK